ncbi:TniQ family protein [Paraburkholderia sp. BR10954]|uniref:TniQ family protein n=1 Tax=Paraburkholderia sp. BR10954 TaxID=3236995 RepID=UPI0034D1E046
MPILLKPAQDEFLLGVIGRLTHLNIGSSCVETMRSLVAHFELEEKHRPATGRHHQTEAYLEALASTSGKSVFEFLFDHSNFAAQGVMPTPAVAAPWLYRRMHRTKIKPYSHRTRLQLCKKCLPEQVRNLGFPFWHRQHQLDGIYWCPVHATPLLALDGWPAQDTLIPVATVASQRTPASAADFEKYPVLRSVCDVMTGFLRHPLLDNVTRIDDCLREQAVARGLCRHDGDPAMPSDLSFLTDLAFNACPAWWLRKVFRLRKETARIGDSALHNVFSGRGRASSVSYALALALLLSPRERADMLDRPSDPSS